MRTDTLPSSGRIRFFAVLEMLAHEKLTIDQIAARLNVTTRTVRRNLNFIDALCDSLEVDFKRRYFFNNEKCPICRRGIYEQR